MIRPIKKMCSVMLAASLVWTAVSGAVSVNAEEKTSDSNYKITDRVATFIEPIYDDQCLFRDNIAFIENGLWGGETSTETNLVFVDKKGNKTVISNENEKGEKIFDSAYPAISAFWYTRFDAMKLTKNDKVAIMNFKGEYIGGGDFYKFAQPITENVLLVSDDNITYRIINKDGDITVDNIKDIDLEFSGYTNEYRIERCKWGFAIECVDNLYIIDNEGNLLYEAGEKLEINYAGGDYSIIKKVNSGKQLLVDDEGNVVWQFEDDVYYISVDSPDYVRYWVSVEEEGISVDKCLIMNINTGEIVSNTYSDTIFDGYIIIGDVNKEKQSVYNVNGDVYIEDLDEMVKNEGYELTWRGSYYNSGYLVLPVRKSDDNQYQYMTYIYSADSGFSNREVIQLEGYLDNSSFDKYICTVDNDGYLKSLYITDKKVVKEYDEKKYIPWCSSSDPEYLLDVYVYEDEENLGRAYVKNNGEVTEILLSYYAYDFTTQNGVSSVVNEDGKIIYSGNGTCQEYTKDCFSVQEENGYYIYDSNGNIIFEGNGVRGQYWFCECDDLQIISVGNGENTKYGAIRVYDNIPISDAEIKLSANKYIHNGNAIKAKVETVTVDGEILTEGNDYTVSYKNNIKVGKATVVITGKGDYTGTCSTTFDIVYGTGMYKGTDGKWYYYVNGKVDTSYIGLAKNAYGWWYMNKGKLDTSYTGLVKYKTNWVYVSNGKLDSSYTGLVKYKTNWVYVNNGKLDTSYTGLVKYKSNWVYVNKGKLDATYTGLVKYKSNWVYVNKGKLDASYTGLVKYKSNWIYVNKGKLDTSFIGMAKNPYGWWYVTKGKLDLTYTGIAKNAYGTWYLQKGKLDLTFSGKVTVGGKTYTVKNGKVK